MIVNEFFTNNTGKLEYPFLFIENASDALAVFVENIPGEGNIPLLIKYKTNIVKICDILNCPYILKRLTSLFEVTLFVDEVTALQNVTIWDMSKLSNFKLRSLV